MVANKLKLNEDKTEVLIGTRQQLTEIDFTSIHVGDEPSTVLRRLKIWAVYSTKA